MYIDELTELLAKFGMIIRLDDSPDADRELQRTQLAHALVGVAEAHASRAEQRYRDAGATPSDLAEASLMAFAGVNCHTDLDEWGLISWRANRLAGALAALGIADRDKHPAGSLPATLVLVAAALSGIAQAVQTSLDPDRADGDALSAGLALSKAMDALDLAAGASARHCADADLIQLLDVDLRRR
jgi:hypothetical protein